VHSVTVRVSYRYTLVGSLCSGCCCRRRIALIVLRGVALAARSDAAAALQVNQTIAVRVVPQEAWLPGQLLLRPPPL
jgi:hypothetical protein